MLILPGKDDGTFAAPIESVGLADYQSVAAVDLDDDGRLDLAMLAGFTPDRVYGQSPVGPDVSAGCFGFQRHGGRHSAIDGDTVCAHRRNG